MKLPNISIMLFMKRRKSCRKQLDMRPPLQVVDTAATKSDIEHKANATMAVTNLQANAWLDGGIVASLKRQLPQSRTKNGYAEHAKVWGYH